MRAIFGALTTWAFSLEMLVFCLGIGLADIHLGAA
jgi:hypothetical protein